LSAGDVRASLLADEAAKLLEAVFRDRKPQRLHDVIVDVDVSSHVRRENAELQAFRGGAKLRDVGLQAAEGYDWKIRVCSKDRFESPEASSKLCA